MTYATPNYLIISLMPNNFNSPKLQNTWYGLYVVILPYLSAHILTVLSIFIRIDSVAFSSRSHLLSKETKLPTWQINTQIYSAYRSILLTTKRCLSLLETFFLENVTINNTALSQTVLYYWITFIKTSVLSTNSPMQKNKLQKKKVKILLFF